MVYFKRKIDCFGSKTVGMLCLLVTIILMGNVRFSVAAPQFPDEDDLARLQRGEILLQVMHRDKPGAAARVTSLFYASEDKIWDTVGDCKYEFIYVRGLQLCEVLESGQQHIVKRHRVRTSWYTPTLDFTFEATRMADGNGQARLVDGDLKVLEVQWKLLPLADSDKVIVIHEIRVQSRIPAPRWLVRRTLLNDLPDMLACIRGLASASGDENRISGDLERCAGEVSARLK